MKAENPMRIISKLKASAVRDTGEIGRKCEEKKMEIQSILPIEING